MHAASPAPSRLCCFWLSSEDSAVYCDGPGPQCAARRMHRVHRRLFWQVLFRPLAQAAVWQLLFGPEHYEKRHRVRQLRGGACRRRESLARTRPGQSCLKPSARSPKPEALKRAVLSGRQRSGCSVCQRLLARGDSRLARVDPCCAFFTFFVPTVPALLSAPLVAGCWNGRGPGRL